MRFLIYISFLLIPFVVGAQKFADKEYYLIDSLVLEELSENERILIDSCLSVYHKTKEDTTKINALYNICENMFHEDWSKYQFFEIKLISKALGNKPSAKVKKNLIKALANALYNIGYLNKSKGNNTQAIDYYHKSLKIYEEIGDEKGKVSSLTNIGLIYGSQGDNIQAIEYHQKSLKISEETIDKSGVATSLVNIGSIYEAQGKIENSLKYYYSALKINEEISDKRGIALSLNKIGMLYLARSDFKTSLEYLQKSYVFYNEIGDKYGKALCLNNIGLVSFGKGDYPKALNSYHNSFSVLEEIGHEKGIASVFNNIGNIYSEQKNYPKSLEYYQKTYELGEKTNDIIIIAGALNNLAALYRDMGILFKAQQYGEKSLAISKSIGYPEKIKYTAELLSSIYEKQENFDKALEMYKLHIQMRDSLNNEETQKVTAQQQAKYEYEKQKALDDAEHEKQIAIEQEAKEKQQIITYATGGGLGLVGVFLIFVFNRLQVTKKQKLVIEEQKKEVESQKEVVELAHSELEEKNQEIMDSITYAKRIQNAILPPLKVVKEYLTKSFILYKPKDIVAGDFYWMEHKGGRVLFAAADCTGHGVPGAMVSVVCNNGLNRSVREYGLTDPGEILNKTREIVIAEFEKSEEEVKDGMDIALCSLEGNTLKYAGANNPLWIIRNGEIIETKADKQPIGKFDELLPYTTHTFELQKGDTIYIFSDGYVDQFGGEKGKKFKAKAFRELLLSIQDQSMDDQKIIIDSAFENWRGNLEQIDDVCVIGVKV
jgi:serine phosphatase RsbU (regulator of sigma subunit)